MQVAWWLCSLGHTRWRLEKAGKRVVSQEKMVSWKGPHLIIMYLSICGFITLHLYICMDLPLDNEDYVSASCIAIDTFDQSRCSNVQSYTCSVLMIPMLCQGLEQSMFFSLKLCHTLFTFLIHCCGQPWCSCC